MRLALKLLLLFVVGGGSFARLGLATQAFFRVLSDAAVAAKVQPLLAPPGPELKPKRSAEPLRLLTILQREGGCSTFYSKTFPGPTTRNSAPACAKFTRRAGKS